jgi:hypothetical protein
VGWEWTVVKQTGYGQGLVCVRMVGFRTDFLYD